MKTIFLLLLAVSTGFCAETSSGLGGAEELGSIQSGADKLRADVSGAGSSTELFKIIERDGEILLELRLNQLERNYLFSATMEKGTGERGVFSTMMEDTFLWTFHWTGTNVQLLRRKTAYRADPDTPEARAIENSFSDSILATLPVLSSEAAKGTVLVSASQLFLTDLLGIMDRLQTGPYPEPFLSMRLADQESSIEHIYSFPRNMEARVQLVFIKGPGSQPSGQLADTRRIAITMHYSLSLLPESDSFAPRPADERVGYFETTFRDMSEASLKRSGDPAVSFIHRWNLEKKEPAAPVSDVKEPVVFWLEDTIPHEYRPAIRAGILAWNAAFEEIGLRGALQVKEVDKDMPAEERDVFDPANASYNMVRWFMGEKAGFAIGPSRVNPLTGEIFNASISISDFMTRGTFEIDLAEAAALSLAGGQDQGYQAQASRELAVALAALEAKHGPLTEAEKNRYYDELLTHIVIHEVGHTLGLRHNFKGSELLPQDRLGENGLVSSSIMDYLPVHIAGKGQPQGMFHQTQVGPYDRWAVEYGYKPLSAEAAKRQNELAEIAARSGRDSRLAYGTDEDTGGIDPDTQLFDLGRDQLDFAKKRVSLAQGLWKQLESRQPSAEEGYASLRESYTNGFQAISSGVRAVLPIIGGIRTSRDRPGQGQPPYEPVPVAEQRAVLGFLEEVVFNAETFKVSPQLLSRMGSKRSEFQSSRPLPVDALALSIQKMALQKLHSPQTLKGLEEGSRLSAESSDALTPIEVMGTVRAAVWKELSKAGGAAIPSLRQALQREHLQILTHLAQSGDGIARAAAYDGLLQLQQEISKALSAGGIDSATRLHLADMLAQIQRSPRFLTAAL